MKKTILITILIGSISTVVFGQQWVNFANGANMNRVTIGNLGVGGDSITVEALFSFTASSSSDIVSKHSSPNTNNYLLRVHSFEMRTNAGFKQLLNPICLYPDTIYHVAGTYDGDSMRFFLNGVQVSSVAWSGDLALNNLNAIIGNRANGFNEQFLGYIDEVRIWNVVRTQTEIASNMYDLPNPTTQTGLLAYYKFDGNYTNVQGNTTWDGVVNGAQISLMANPYFNGAVSNNFCNPAGITEYKSESTFKVYPNPNAGVFKIVFDKSILKCNIEILNMLGENIFEANTFNESTKEINLQNLSAGVYFVKVNDGKNYYGKKITVVHD
ncbi:MAG: LamG-like jellyroll fold domain-containing protein [Bacteroidia bacterium]